jgi:hypothetical protein
MIIKKMCYKHDLGWYVDDSIEFHSLQEVKDYCYKLTNCHPQFKDVIYYRFKIMNTDEILEILCSVAYDKDGFSYIKVEGNF